MTTNTPASNNDGANNSDAKGPDSFVTEAYNLENEKSMKQFYAKWAADYDQQMLVELGYVSPFLIAEALKKNLPNKKSRILDIGCGTGLTVVDLSKAGYTHLYGIDLSEDMVEVAGSRGIYTNLKTGDVNQPLDYDDNFFDGAISSGTFTHGHVGPKPLREICRILKPGGIIACTVHMDLWETMEFKQEFKLLVSNGIIECLSLDMDKFYETGDAEGWFCVYRKL